MSDINEIIQEINSYDDELNSYYVYIEYAYKQIINKNNEIAEYKSKIAQKNRPKKIKIENYNKKIKILETDITHFLEDISKLKIDINVIENEKMKKYSEIIINNKLTNQPDLIH